MDNHFSRENGAHFFSIGLITAMLGLLFWLISPFFGALVGAITLGISFFPLHVHVKKIFPTRSSSFHAFLSDLLVVLLTVAPLLIMAWAVVEYADTWTPLITGWQENILRWKEGQVMDSSSGMKSFFSWLSHRLAMRPSQFRLQLMKAADYLLNFLGSVGAEVAAGFFASLINVAIIIFVLFFVFRDGPAMYAKFQNYLPLRPDQKLACKQQGSRMITGVIRGWLLGSIIQGIVATLGYTLAGVEAWVFFGFLTMLTGLLPTIGTALVWLPLAIHSFVHGAVWQGVFLIGWGFLVVSLIDNVLRPYLVGKNSDIPFVYLFFSLLGGLQVWGIKGIILGPLLVAIAPVIFDIYKLRYQPVALEEIELKQESRSHH